jgi:hypothetical protein
MQKIPRGHKIQNKIIIIPKKKKSKLNNLHPSPLRTLFNPNLQIKKESSPHKIKKIQLRL